VKHSSGDLVIIDLSLARAPLSGSRHIFRKLNPFLVVILGPDRDVYCRSGSTNWSTTTSGIGWKMFDVNSWAFQKSVRNSRRGVVRNDGKA
jgi:hypothetical protein